MGVIHSVYGTRKGCLSKPGPHESSLVDSRKSDYWNLSAVAGRGFSTLQRPEAFKDRWPHWEMCGLTEEHLVGKWGLSICSWQAAAA